uniref:probable basic-leucine zipper transcription factor E n=1 Tax=Erigeron canadensis TaxID=72917 RepID=UPI001CB8C657|nr:probable basic-leucine zipper transcription factor E [Erigeron canadensis]
MEGVGARLGRSSTRYGPATVFTGPVRKWKKKWIHVTPPNAVVSSTNNNNNNNQQTVGINNSSNGNNNNNNNNENGSHILLYKWAPISQSQTQSQSGNGHDVKDDDASDGEHVVEPPRRKIKYIPIALLEEQKKESSEEEHIDDSIETDLDSKVDHENGKPDMNDVPMEENQVSEETNVGRQDLNESTLDLNARDGDEDTEETKDEAQ